MAETSDFRSKKIELAHGRGAMPALGFGTLIPDPATTISATRDALKTGYRHLDCAERYRNEREVGEALRIEVAAEEIAREDLFVTTKLWNSNHRPERVEPACDASLERLGLDYLDLYLIHTPFAFQPGDEQDPRDESGQVIYDKGVTLLETWRAMENLVDNGKCRAIGLSDIGLNDLQPLYESARIKPAAVQVEAHPYLPETELLEFCKEKGIVFLAFAPLGHGIRPGPVEDPVISANWKNTRTSTACLGDPTWRSVAHHPEDNGPRAGKFRYLRTPDRGVRRDQPDRNEAAIQRSRQNRQPRIYSATHTVDRGERYPEVFHAGTDHTWRARCPLARIGGRRSQRRT
jgi:alcohol dehydrogenase (NADP+)